MTDGNLISRDYVLLKFKEQCDRCGKYKENNGVMCRCCALDDAIDYVEDAPSAEKTDGDLISRKQAEECCLNGWNKKYKEILEDIRKLPRVKVGNSNSPTVKYCIDEVLIYDLLERYKGEAVGEITREEAIKKLKSFCHNCSEYPQCVNTDRECFEALEMAIEALSAEKTAEWIIKDGIFGVAYCSKCDYELHTNDTNYCPNCGRRMKGVGE